MGSEYRGVPDTLSGTLGQLRRLLECMNGVIAQIFRIKI